MDTAPLTLQPIRCLDDVLPGDVGFSTIGGRLGRGISWGQTLLRDECIFTHAFLVLPGGFCIEAMPAGARIVPITAHRGAAARWGPGVAYGRVPLSASQRAQMDLLARWGTTGASKRFTRALEGRPYAFDDYLALALWEWGLWGGRRLRRKIAGSDRLICSQLVDFAWTTVGYQLFDDGRLPGDVTPGQLFWQVLRKGLITVPAA